jgi:hypothetical protein
VGWHNHAILARGKGSPIGCQPAMRSGVSTVTSRGVVRIVIVMPLT